MNRISVFVDLNKKLKNMESKLIFRKSFKVNVPVSQVWDALTKPELVKQYFFGTEVSSDWKKGSPIFYRGVWEGKPYEDKGNILDIEKGKFIRYNYWSSFSGTDDIPANYANIGYELSQENECTLLIITQDGFKDKEALDHSEKNWVLVVDGLKKLVEG
jgi:uncharacterized protein YndB with AHSA1/START domain